MSFNFYQLQDNGGLTDLDKEIKYLEDKGVLHVRTSGVYEVKKEIETVTKIASELSKYDCNKCIIDHRNTIVSGRIIDSYERSEKYSSYGVKRFWKCALVFKKFNEDVVFFENVCRNRGWDFKVFIDYDEGLLWLLE